MPLVLTPDGPGVTVDLREAAQGLPSAPRGTSALMGQFCSGPTTKAALALTPEAARLISGDPDDDFEASLALSDVYSEDSPITLIARVTDGLDVRARSHLWDRDPNRSFSRTSKTVNDSRTPIATAYAQNGGRWGGRKRVILGDLPTPATDITASTIDLGAASEVADAMLVDLFAGALLYLEGDDASPYEIVSNDLDGVATIKGEFSDAAQAADGSGAINGQFRVVLDHSKELSVVVPQDSVVGERFSLKAERKFSQNGGWETVSAYDSLGLNSGDDRPWLATIIDGESLKYQIEVESDYTGETVEAKFPSNFCEVPTSISGATLTYQWYRWSHAGSNSGNSYLSAIAAIDTGSIEPHVYTLTFTAATTFTVTVTWPDGTTQTLASGTTGVSYNPSHPQLSSFTLTAGTVAHVANDVVTIRVDTLPHDLFQREAFLYPVAVSDDGNSNQRLRIVANTYNTVTVRSDLDLDDFGATVGASAEVIGTVDLTAVSLVAATTVILTPDGGSSVTLTISGTPGPGAAAIAAALTALDTANKFIFSAGGAGNAYLRIRVNGSYGFRSSILVGNGTANGALGLTNGDLENGTDAVPFRIEARWPMWGGYDGGTPGSARYVLAADLSDHLFKCHMGRNLGLVRVGTPGITATAVKSALEALVSSVGWIYIAEFASSIEALSLPGEGAVDDMVTNESESDYVEHYFPSRGKFENVARTRLVTRSLTGVIMGRRSWLANVGTDGERGAHIAAANNNEQGRLSGRVKGLSDDIGRWSPPIKLLNDHGIIPVLWEGPDVYLFGNRMYSAGRTPQGNRYTVTERAVHYHIARDLFVTARPFIFKTIKASRLGDIQVALRTKMKTYFLDGWFSDDGGRAAGFEQQCIVEVPLNLNPPENLLEGLVTAIIQYRPRPALENLKIILAPRQLSA